MEDYNCFKCVRILCKPELWWGSIKILKCLHMTSWILNFFVLGYWLSFFTQNGDSAFLVSPFSSYSQFSFKSAKIHFLKYIYMYVIWIKCSISMTLWLHKKNYLLTVIFFTFSISFLQFLLSTWELC